MDAERLFGAQKSRKHPTMLGRIFNCLTCDADVYRPPSTTKSKVFCGKGCSALHGLEVVACRWPGCFSMMPARAFKSDRFGKIWKVELARGKGYARNPICQRHTALVREHLPERNRIQMGHTHWFKDPSKNLGTRGITSDAVKLMVWAKTGGCCASCRCPLSMAETPRGWHIDHVIPVFKGGLTTYANLMPMCASCHRIKSSPERSEAGRNRRDRHKSRRWLTHPEKDALIAELRAEVDWLRAQIARGKEWENAEEGQRRRVPGDSKRVRHGRRNHPQGGQSALEL